MDGQIIAEECTTTDQLQAYEYLDDVTFCGNQHTMKGTDRVLESFVDTDKVINKIELDNAALEALETDADTERALEILQLQPSRQRADDPRRGGKTRYTESVGSTIRENSDETDNTLEVKEYWEACNKPDEQKKLMKIMPQITLKKVMTSISMKRYIGKHLKQLPITTRILKRKIT